MRPRHGDPSALRAEPDSDDDSDDDGPKPSRSRRHAKKKPSLRALEADLDGLLLTLTSLLHTVDLPPAAELAKIVSAADGEYRRCWAELEKLAARDDAGAKVTTLREKHDEVGIVLFQVHQLARPAPKPLAPEKPETDTADGERTDARRDAARTLLHSLRVARRMHQTLDREHIHEDPDRGVRSPLIQDRKDELEDHHGTGHLAEQYGLQSVKFQGAIRHQGELRSDHPATPVYQRHNHRDDELFKRLLTSQGYDETELGTRYFVVNSPTVVPKLEFFLQGYYAKSLAKKDRKHALNVKPLGPGLYLLDVQITVDELPSLYVPTERMETAKVLKMLLIHIGATPSHYEMIKMLSGAQHTKRDDRLHNSKLLEKLLASAPVEKLASIAASPRHHQRAVVSAVLGMVRGLSDCATTPEFEHDDLVADALHKLQNLLHVLWQYADHTERASRIYSLILEELYLILAVVKPYGREDYKHIVRGIEDERVPELARHANWNRQSHLAASGMDALTTGYVAASQSHDRTGFDMPEKAKGTDYFEVEPVVDYRAGVSDKGAVVVYCLNPSTPLNVPDADAMIELVKEKLAAKGSFKGKKHPTVSLVIDTTIEVDEGKDGQLDYIFQELAGELDSGRLQILLAKSYQKYASHGSGKVMAGNLTLINSGDKFEQTDQFMAGADDESDNYDLDESQLMMHMLKHGHREELGLLQHAAENAALVHSLWPSNAAFQRAGWMPGMPFVVKKNEKFQSARDEHTLPSDALTKLGCDARDSFGFQRSSVLTIKDGFFRINPGQESPAELTETFYAMSALMTERKAASANSGDPLSIMLADVIALMNREIEDFRGLRLDTSGGDYHALFSVIHVGLERFAGNEMFCNRIASCLHFAATINHPTGARARQLLDVLEAFLVTGPTGLSPTMRRHLTRHLVTLAAACGPDAIAASLGSIEHGCRSVPAFVGYELFRDTVTEPIFEGLWGVVRTQLTATLLTGVADGDLKALVEQLENDGATTKAAAVTAFRNQDGSASTFEPDGLLAPSIIGPAVPRTDAY